MKMVKNRKLTNRILPAFGSWVICSTAVAAPGDDVTLTSAQLISKPWKLWEDGIYRTQVGAIDAIDQLFLDGSRQVLARYPNLGAGFVTEREDKLVHGKAAGNVPSDGGEPNAWGLKRAPSWAVPTGNFLHGMEAIQSAISPD